MNSFAMDSDYLNLVRDFNTIAKVRPLDKLAVSEGKLILNPAGLAQSPLRIVKNLFYGGYSRNVLASYLENLAQKTEDLAKKYNLCSPDFKKVDPVEYKKLAQLVKLAALKVSDIEFRYRPKASLERGFAAKRLSKVCGRIVSARDSLIAQVKAHPQIFHLLPKAPIDFDAPVDLAIIKCKAPRGHTAEDILKLAESAKKQVIPTWKRIARAAAFVFATVPLAVPLQILTLFKWVIWNPVEFLIKGEVTTKNPFLWWMDLWPSNPINGLSDPQIAVQRYARQLLSVPYVTKTHVDAFSKLANEVEEVDLNLCDLGSSDLEELLDVFSTHMKMGYSEDLFSFGPLAKETLQKVLFGEVISLGMFQALLKSEYIPLKWLDDPNWQTSGAFRTKLKAWKDGFYGDINDPDARQRYLLENLTEDYMQNEEDSSISPKNLIQVIDAVAKHRKCRKVLVPLEIPEVPAIEAALKKGGFKQDEQFDWVYNR